MRESVVILPPDRGRDQQVQRRNIRAPREVVADGQPLRVLIEHGVDHVDEGFVGREEAVTSSQQVAFEHALERMLAEHLDDASIRCQFAAVGIFGEVFVNPDFLAHLVNVLQLVGGVFVRTEDAEVLHVQLHDVAQKCAQRTRIFRFHGSRACRPSARTNGNPEGAEPSSADLHWRADWRSSCADPWEPVLSVPQQASRFRRTALRAFVTASTFQVTCSCTGSFFTFAIGTW